MHVNDVYSTASHGIWLGATRSCQYRCLSAVRGNLSRRALLACRYATCDYVQMLQHYLHHHQVSCLCFYLVLTNEPCLQVVGVMQMQWDKHCNFQPDIILAADVLYDPGELHWQVGIVHGTKGAFPVPDFTPCLPVNAACANWLTQF